MMMGMRAKQINIATQMLNRLQIMLMITRAPITRVILNARLRELVLRVRARKRMNDAAGDSQNQNLLTLQSP